jgi:hypothetical protein
MYASLRILIAIVSIISLVTCAKDSPPRQITFQKDAEIMIITFDNSEIIFDVEIADTETKRMHGLMDRYTLEANQGMLFIFDRADFQSFWMKNTYISLDIIFIDEEYLINQIYENAFPLCEKPIIGDYRSIYVLEILGGLSTRLSIKVGDRILIK